MTTALLHRFSAFLRYFCAFVFAVATTQCGGDQPNSIYYINVLDAPPEVHQYIGTQLFINDKFVKLSESGKIIPSKTQDEKKAAFKKIDHTVPITYFKPFAGMAQTSYNNYANNYRMDIRFKYDSLGAMQSMLLHIEKIENGFWHGYADSGMMPLNLDAKQSRLPAKKQQKIVLERIVANIKKIAFK